MSKLRKFSYASIPPSVRKLIASQSQPEKCTNCQIALNQKHIRLLLKTIGVQQNFLQQIEQTMIFHWQGQYLNQLLSVSAFS